jgi:hypothetical protein
MEKGPSTESVNIGVASSTEADAGAVGRIPAAADPADATRLARTIGEAFVDTGRALDGVVSDEQADVAPLIEHEEESWLDVVAETLLASARGRSAGAYTRRKGTGVTG